MIRIGIDPGKKGFIVMYNDYNDDFDIAVSGFEYYPIPLINKEVDLNSLSEMFSLDQNYVGDVHCCIEDVHAIFGSAAKATFNFGWNVGVLEAFLVANEIPYTKVKPKEWQKEMWQGIPEIKLPDKKVFIDEKGKRLSNKRAKELLDIGVNLDTKIIKGKKDSKSMSLLAAKRLFPNEDMRATERCTTPHDGKVDALLLCEYCKRKF